MVSMARAWADEHGTIMRDRRAAGQETELWPAHRYALEFWARTEAYAHSRWLSWTLNYHHDWVYDLEEIKAVAVETVVWWSSIFASWCEGKTIDNYEAVFWSTAKLKIDSAFAKLFERRVREHRSIVVEGESGEEIDPGQVWTQLRVKQRPTLLSDELAAFIGTLAERDQTVMALRHYEGLGTDPIAKLMGLNLATVSTIDGNASRKVLAYALTRTQNVTLPTITRSNRPALTPALAGYLQRQYGAELPAYLAFVRRMASLDTSFLVAILGRAHGEHVQQVKTQCSAWNPEHTQRCTLAKKHDDDHQNVESGDQWAPFVRLCEVDGCDRKYHSRGMCNTHEMAERRARTAA